MAKPDGPGRGSNSIYLRQYNERSLLQRLRRAGEASKADLARWAQLTNTAVGSIIQSLEEAQLIEPAGRRQDGQRGQPAGLYRIHPAGAYGVGVRLDRSRIEVVLIDLGGTVLAHEAYDQLLPHPTEALRLVQASITRMLKTLTPEQRQRLMGVGLAQPDHLGSWLRELDLEADFRAWDEFDFGARLAQALGQPVYRENDGNAAAIAELFFGVGHEESDFLYVFLGAALGGGAVVGGESLRGCSGNAADLGLMPVRPSRLASATPAGHEWDLLLSRASLNALTRHLRHHGLAVRSHDALAQLVEAQRPEVQEWLDDCIDALVPSLRAALAVLDVPTVVIDCNIDHGLVDQLMRRVDAGLQAIAPEARPAPHVRRGSFGANAGAVGAASLPMFFSFSPRADVLRGQPVDASVPRATPARKWPGGPGA